MCFTLFTWCLSCFLCGYFPDPLETRDKQNHLNHNGLGNNHTGSKKTPSKSVKCILLKIPASIYLLTVPVFEWLIDWLMDWLFDWLIDWLTGGLHVVETVKCLLEDKNNGKYFWLVVAYGSWPLTRGGCSTEWFNCSFFMWGGHHICISLCMCNWEV